MTNPLPKNLALAQLRLRSITAGLAIDVATLPVEAPDSLAIDDGRNGFKYDAAITVARYPKDGYGAARCISISIRELLALARLESDHPARAPIADPPTRLSAPPPAEARRLVGMLKDVQDIMSDGIARTLPQIQVALRNRGFHHQLPAISARLRDLRKSEFGGHQVEREKVKGERGLFRYRLVPRVQQ